jgi:uncharacterized membrane protein YphA (DoxX/SURF4 family)
MKYYLLTIRVLLGLFMIYAGIEKFLFRHSAADTEMWQAAAKEFMDFYLLLQNTNFLIFVACCQILFGVLLFFKPTHLLAAIMFVPMLSCLIATHIFISHNIGYIIFDTIIFLLNASIIFNNRKPLYQTIIKQYGISNK